MTLTLTELSTTDYPVDLKSGAQKRRKLVFIRATSATAADTLNIATYVPGAADIEGISYETLDSAINAGTAMTWSTTTLTFGGHAGSGVWELMVLVNLT